MQIIKYGKFFIIASLLVLVPGFISLAVFGMNLAIDFTGGSNFEYKFVSTILDSAKLDEIKDLFSKTDIEIKEARISSGNVLDIKTKPVDTKKGEEIKSKLSEKYGQIDTQLFETVGPAIGAETTRKSFVAVGVASLGILFYIAFAFRNIPKPYSSFRFGASAIIAMLHDAFMVLGIFSILGHFFSVEIDSLFITAVLTVIGFSVHDTIVVFDRIRENLRKLPDSWNFDNVVNYSILETLNRSLSTSLTVIITLLSLLVLGGESIRYFSLALLIGIVSGTYSSIFTAAPILVIWEKLSLKKSHK
jgi:preprotein translocase subunit SecF